MKIAKASIDGKHGQVFRKSIIARASVKELYVRLLHN